MHRLIRILVFARDAEGALDAAHEVAHKKLGNTSQGGTFDYYIDFTHDTTWRVPLLQKVLLDFSKFYQEELERRSV